MPLADSFCRSDGECVQWLEERGNDRFFDFAAPDIIGTLSWDAAKEFFKEEFIAQVESGVEKYEPRSRLRKDVLKELHEYVPFAWRKANDCRGISAGRSIDHFIAWTWLAGDTELSRLLDTVPYTHYGKPHLRQLCRYYGIDFGDLDDGYYCTSERAPMVHADDVPDPFELPEVPRE